ncbi:Epoxyqueuosine reductase [anaerobic digester metagenome]
MSILSEIKSRYADYRLNKINKMETSVSTGEMGIESSTRSPPKIMPDKLKITLKTLPKQLSIAKNMEHTVKSLRYNPENPETTLTDGFKEEFEGFASSIGIDKVAYTPVPPEFIFQDRKLIYENAIILVMEMDKKAIDNAPSSQTQEMGVVTYDELGKATNHLTDFLRENGVAAQASHPAGGFVVYPALAQKAGLGWKGRHGMLITPEFGPRQRISVIFTSINNLPDNGSNSHSWVSSFCEKCGKCIKACPGNAITEESDASSIKRTVILKEFCHGCTICMKECSFNKRGYDQIKTKNRQFNSK